MEKSTNLFSYNIKISDIDNIVKSNCIDFIKYVLFQIKSEKLTDNKAEEYYLQYVKNKIIAL